MKFFDKIWAKLSSMDLKQWIVLIVLVIIAVWLIKKASSELSRSWRRFWEGSRIDDGTDVSELTDTRKSELEDIANEVYNDIYGWWTDAEESLSKLLGLNDAEFVYTVDYYEKYLSDNSLYYDIDEEWLPATDVDEDVLARLSQMNLG